jgi:hypothetical protein
VLPTPYISFEILGRFGYSKFRLADPEQLTFSLSMHGNHQRTWQLTARAILWCDEWWMENDLDALESIMHHHWAVKEEGDMEDIDAKRQNVFNDRVKRWI